MIQVDRRLQHGCTHSLLMDLLVMICVFNTAIEREGNPSRTGEVGEWNQVSGRRGRGEVGPDVAVGVRDLCDETFRKNFTKYCSVWEISG